MSLFHIIKYPEIWNDNSGWPESMDYLPNRVKTMFSQYLRFNDLSSCWESYGTETRTEIWRKYLLELEDD